MDKIFLPIKVHAVKLEYLRLKLEKMPHGYFNRRRGQSVVVVTYEPDNPKCSSKRPRIFFTSTKRGKLYTEIINGYLNIKKEFDYLLTRWNSTYCFAPPRVKFPIKQFHDPHLMNNEYYNSKEDNLGKYVPDNPTISEYGEFKSKNELMAATALKQMDIPFKYETELYIEETDEKINPDFLINFFEIDRCSYLEVLGMNDKGDYAVRTSAKINSYSRGEYRPGREVIYVLMYDKYNFDEVYFIQQVLSAFDSMIPDSALEWGKDFFSIQLSSSDESCGNTTLGYISFTSTA